MKKYAAAAILVLSVCIAKAQTGTTIDEAVPSGKIDTNSVFTAVQKSAEFPGGIVEFYNYLKKNSKYSIADKTPYKKVVLSFIIQKNGTLTDIEVLRPATEELNAEAVRLIKNSPKWVPGEEQHYKVKQKFFCNINFADK